MWNPFKRKPRKTWIKTRVDVIALLLYCALERSHLDTWLPVLEPDEAHMLGSPDRLEQSLLDLWLTTEAFTAVARTIKLDSVTRDTILDDLHREAWRWMQDKNTLIGRTRSSPYLDLFPDLVAPRYAEYRQSLSQFLGGAPSLDLARAVLEHVFPQRNQERDSVVLLVSLTSSLQHGLFGLIDLLKEELRNVSFAVGYSST